MRSLIVALSVAVLIPACSSGPAPEPEPETGGTGWLVVTVRDGESGKPVTDCHYYGMKFAAEKAGLESAGHREVDFRNVPESETGVYRWQLDAGWHRLRLEADDYWRAWTPAFRIEAGAETKLEFPMHRNVLLRVTVLDPDGQPLPKGTVRVEMGDLLGSVDIENGRGEVWIEDDEVTLGVGRIWMKEYREQTITMSLTPGEVNEVTIRLTR